MRRETPAFAQQKWPGGTLYHYGLCELAQRQAVLMRQDKSQGRAIKSDRAKVVMTAGCISKIFDIQNYIYNSRERGNSINQNWHKNDLSKLDSNSERPLFLSLQPMKQQLRSNHILLICIVESLQLLHLVIHLNLQARCSLIVTLQESSL